MRIVYIDGYCFQRVTGRLIISKYNDENETFVKIQEISSGSVPKVMKNVFNNFSIENVKLYLIKNEEE
jgi:hypothetical protein